MTSEPNTPPPLDGITVLECSSHLGAPAGTLLAALGARVVRIEDPGADPLRESPHAGRRPHAGTSLAYLKYTRGKEPLPLTANDPGLDALLADLAAASDLVLTDELAPHSAALDNVLRRLETRPVVVRMRGFPADSPRSDAPFTDLTLDAASGQLFMNGFPGRAPAYPAGNQSYQIASLVAAAGAVAALFACLRGGRSPEIVVSAQEALALSTVEQANVNQWLWKQEIPTRLGVATHGHGGLMQAADGKWVVLNINEGRRMLRWFEDEGLGVGYGPEWDDPEFWYAAYDEEVAPRLRELVSRYPADPLVRKAQSYRLLTMPVATIGELVANEQLAHRGFFEDESGLTFHRLPWTTGFRPATTLPDAVPGEKPALPARAASGAGTGLLAGVRILEFCGGIAGPLTTRFFANLGAEVIKIESEDPPDVLRTVGLQPPQRSSLNTNAVFNDCNTGKYSISLNLRSPEAVGLARGLIAGADAIVTSFTPGVLDKFGLGFDDAVAINPRIIYYASSVYGAEGPLAGYRSYGSGITAAAGLSLVMGEPGDPPVGLGNFHSDYTGPYFSALALLSALLLRDREPGAQFIDFSQVEGAAWLLGSEILEYTDTGSLPGQRGNRSATMAPHGLFRCLGDDEWCAVAVRSDAEWRRLCDLIGQTGLFPAFGTLQERLAGAAAVDEALAPWFAGRAKWDAASALSAAGIPASPVENNRDLAEVDEGLRGTFTDVDHPEGPRFRVMREPILVDGVRPTAIRAPLLGEHTEVVLHSLLGLDEDQVSALYAEGAIG